MIIDNESTENNILKHDKKMNKQYNCNELNVFIIVTNADRMTNTQCLNHCAITSQNK